MKKKVSQEKSKSLKTFYLYAALVLILIVISLTVKIFFIFEHSKFDSTHDFIIAIIQQKHVKEIVAFHPQIPATSSLIIQDTIPYETLAKNYGITTDGYIQAQDNDVIGTEMTSVLWSSLLHMTSWQSNLTVLDKIRLLLLAKNVTTSNKTLESISLTKQTSDTNTIIATALTDQDLATENISIQIINATDVSGLGQRLGRVLTNMGANVVDVSTAQDTQQKTTIAYFGNESYTVDRLQKYLGITATKLSRQTIADIVIIIGKDKKNTEIF